MAYIKIILLVNTVYIFLLFVLKVKVLGDKLEQSIYKKITGNAPCVTLLNSAHQIGCKSKRKGNVGVVHYIDSDENFKSLLNGSYSPYIPLFTAEYFTDSRLQQLINADKVSGALVLYSYNNTISGTSPPDSGFSPERRCPNENLGLYGNDENYGCSWNGSKSVTWNLRGSEMSYKDYDIPVFALYKRNEINSLIKCYQDHNKPVNDVNPDYPLCGVELQSFMIAAKDTPTCIRKSNAQKFNQLTFCDALGDHNVWGTLFSSFGDHLTENDVILATTKLDSTAFFHDISPGADNTATGIVVLLAAAHALGSLKNNGSIKHPDLKKKQKHIMFTFFHGEAWDYIGSSRMVHDMLKGDFPEKSLKLPSVDLSNIAYYLELSQVGLLDNNSLWAHRDPQSKDDVRKKTKTMFNTLSKFGVSIKDASEVELQPLPPSSFQRFLKGNRSIPGLVIADHKSAYTNKFYNSRFDDLYAQDFNVTRLKNLATAVAKTLYELAYNERKESIDVDSKLVEKLLYCYLKSQNCSLFKRAVIEKHVKTLNKTNRPMPRYVGPYASAGGPSGISVITKYLLAYFTGFHVNDSKCQSTNESSFVYHSSSGNASACIRASVYLSDALSPAFYIESQTTYLSDNYDPKEYSTWTESRWNTDIGIRMFLIADPTQEAVTLAVGVILTLLSVVVTVFVYLKAEQLFTPSDRVLVINNGDM